MSVSSLKRIEKSMAFTSLVSAPMEMRSTPVSARARTLSSVTPPEISSTARPGVDAHGLAQRRQVHVVQQHHASRRRPAPRRSCASVSTSISTKSACAATSRRGPQHRRHAAGRGDVVFLDQHRVVQADAVVGAAAGAHRVLLRQAQARQRLARVDDLRARAAHRIDVGRGLGRDRAEQLQEVERRALGRQQRAGGAFDLQHHLVGGAALAFGHGPGDAWPAGRAGAGRPRPRAAADHGGLARDTSAGPGGRPAPARPSGRRRRRLPPARARRPAGPVRPRPREKSKRCMGQA